MFVLGVVSPFYAFSQSDPFGRLIVLILFGASVVAWTIMVEKWLFLRVARRQLAGGLDLFYRARSAAEMLNQTENLQGPMRRITLDIKEGLASYRGWSKAELTSAIRGAGLGVTRIEVDHLRNVAETSVDNELLRLEARLGTLGSVVGASPFLGLLGTVWGVMMAFSGMAVAGRADINAIAPGVSGALLTTVVGLVVAIPALIGYNMLVNQVKQLTMKMDNFASELVTGLRQEPGGDR